MEFEWNSSKAIANLQKHGVRFEVVSDEAVAQVFKTPEAVNRVLRALTQSMPTVSIDE
ncbi:hypothetical protein [Vacuolonema iberomarrocanum]|uniref:hypothetical protein n=1 Tax=Vacuolonema iberomarrocanum TaxID=3454632 RepID=UPI0019F65605|nr:hypothetical protein [filamentous cyanobacterium LEGE 07170]